MNAVSVKNANDSIRIAKRLAKLFEAESGSRLVEQLEALRKSPIQAGDVGEAMSKGFLDGLNVGIRISQFSVDELDLGKVIDAVCGIDESGS